VKEGANKGRKFWKCSKSEESQCKFFEWDDQPPAMGPTFGSSGRQVSAQAPGAAASATGECYKCHQPGHWANGECIPLKCAYDLTFAQRALMLVQPALLNKEHLKEETIPATNVGRPVIGPVVSIRTGVRWNRHL
jgi:GRF zinc finger